MPECTALFEACRELYDKLREGSSAMNGEKQVAIVNAMLGPELIMSLMINPERGDLLMLQIRGRSVRVFADPTKWNGLQIENGTEAEVRQFLRAVEQRRRNQRRSGH